MHKLILILALVACTKTGDPGKAGPRDAVIDAWKAPS